MSILRDKETIAASKGEPSDGAAGSSGPASPRPVPVTAIAPPPPSAPSEFLGAQWLTSPCTARAGVPGASLTPPPPSAPSEFLTAQLQDGSEIAGEAQGIDAAEFEAAFPAVIGAVEDLERLAASTQEVSDAPEIAVDVASNDAPLGPPPRIRGVPLVKGEEIARVFLPEGGLVASVPRSGQALILTNRRLIAFRGVEGFRDTHMADAADISQCSVRTGQRNWGAVFQGLMIIVGGALLYLVVGYWLAGQVSGPNVPVLNIDVAPLIALLIILAGLFILVQNYFTRPAGAMIFHGEGTEIAFPFRSSLNLEQVYDFVESAQTARRRKAAQWEIVRERGAGCENSPPATGC